MMDLFYNFCMDIENLVHVKQTKINRCEIVIELSGVSLDKPLSIHASMKYNEESFTLLERSIYPEEISDNRIIISLPNFGKYHIKISDSDENEILYDDVVPVKASQYIIAPLVASTPVLLFMLYYFTDMPLVTKQGDPVPVIITLSRYDQFDYQHLTENMYPNPYITKKDRETESKRQWPGILTFEPKIRHYIKELREIGPDSSFSFYLNDMTPAVLDDVSKRRDLFVLLMDGHMTIRLLKEFFVDTRFGFRRLLKYRNYQLSIGRNEFFDKTVLKILFSKKNQWWIVQKEKIPYHDLIAKRLFANQKKFINPSIPALIQKVKDNGNWGRLIELFGLKETLEEIEPILKGKKTPVFLINNKKQSPLNDFEKAIVCLFGDSCEYFYKFHPALKDKKAIINSPVKLRTISNSAPLELLIPDDRDCIVAGPGSTLFLTLGDNHKRILFENNKESAKYNSVLFGYVSTIDIFVSDPTKDIKDGKRIDQKILPLLSQKEKWILLEFVDEKEYDVGFYDPLDNKIELYKWDIDEYKLVKTVKR